MLQRDVGELDELKGGVPAVAEAHPGEVFLVPGLAVADLVLEVGGSGGEGGEGGAAGEGGPAGGGGGSEAGRDGGEGARQRKEHVLNERLSAPGNQGLAMRGAKEAQGWLRPARMSGPSAWAGAADDGSAHCGAEIFSYIVIGWDAGMGVGSRRRGGAAMTLARPMQNLSSAALRAGYRFVRPVGTERSAFGIACTGELNSPALSPLLGCGAAQGTGTGSALPRPPPCQNQIFLSIATKPCHSTARRTRRPWRVSLESLTHCI